MIYHTVKVIHQAIRIFSNPDQYFRTWHSNYRSKVKCSRQINNRRIPDFVSCMVTKAGEEMSLGRYERLRSENSDKVADNTP